MSSWNRSPRCPSRRSEPRHGARRIAVGVALALTVCGVRVPSVSAGDGRGPAAATRHLGVVGFYNPRLMYVKYQELVDYLTEATGNRWELAVTLDYEETVKALCSGKLDLAYLGPFTYLRVHRACDATPVIRLNTGGSPTYRSLIMVRRESPYRKMSDLAGTVFAFGSPLSTSSHLVPRLMLREAGLHPGKDITCRYFGHHDRAARAVVLGRADACGVRDIVGRRFAGRGLRVLARSDPIPNFPLVVRPGASPEFRRQLVEVLVERPAGDPMIRERMSGWDEELAGGFAPVSDSDYDPVRRLVETVFGKRGLLAPPERLQCGE